MTDSEMLSVLVGALLPFVLSIVIRSGWSTQAKSVLAFVACVPAALATAYVAGSLSFANAHEVTTDVLLVMVAAYAMYNGFYKHQVDVLRSINLPFKIVPNVPTLAPTAVEEAPADAAPVAADPANGNP